MIFFFLVCAKLFAYFDEKFAKSVEKVTSDFVSFDFVGLNDCF
jgi:hypothetical protein